MRSRLSATIHHVLFLIVQFKLWWQYSVTYLENLLNKGKLIGWRQGCVMELFWKMKFYFDDSFVFMWNIIIYRWENAGGNVLSIWAAKIWISLLFHGFHCYYMDFIVITWISLLFHGFHCYYMDFIVIRPILDISNFCLQHIASITIKLGDKPRKLLFYLSFFNFKWNFFKCM